MPDFISNIAVPLRGIDPSFSSICLGEHDQIVPIPKRSKWANFFGYLISLLTFRRRAENPELDRTTRKILTLADEFFRAPPTNLDAWQKDVLSEAFAKLKFCVRRNRGRYLRDIEHKIKQIQSLKVGESTDPASVLIPDCWHVIASKLSIQELLNLKLVSKKFRELAKSLLVKRLLHEKIPLAELGIRTGPQVAIFLDFLKDRRPQLQHLDLTGIRLDRSLLPQLLTNLPNLCTLNLKGNISDEDLQSYILPLVNLTHLSLHKSHITDRGLEWLQALSNLQSLSLSRSIIIHRTTLAALSALVHLQSLDLSYCLGHAHADYGLASLCPLTNLQILNLSGCDWITNKGLAQWRHLPNLRRLTLYNCDEISRTGIHRLSAHIEVFSHFT